MSAIDIWGGNIGDLDAGSRFNAGLYFQAVKPIRQHSNAVSQASVSRIAESGLMRVSATLDSWVEGGSRLNTGSSLGVSMFMPGRGTDFASEPTTTTAVVGEGALTLAPFGRWAGLGARERSVPEVQDWRVHEMFAFRSPGTPYRFWLDDWKRREKVASLDIDEFGPDDNCALIISRWPG